MAAPKSSRAYGRQWGDTTVPVGQSKAEIDKVIKKFDPFAAIQWTEAQETLQLRFRMNGRNYLFNMLQPAEDPHECRRQVRAVHWYIKGILGLGAADEDDLFVERALIPYLEIAPDVSMHAAISDKAVLPKIQAALGGHQLSLQGRDGR